MRFHVKITDALGGTLEWLTIRTETRAQAIDAAQSRARELARQTSRSLLPLRLAITAEG